MLSRRHLLSLTGSAAAMGLLPVRLALADAPTDARFVLAIQRGAMDGLHAVPPYGDPNYAALRGTLALSDKAGLDGVLDLDGRFGLHPKLTELKAWYDQGELLVVHAVATPYRERSHFDGQDLLENGTIQPHAGDSGWLNRTIGLMGPTAGDQRLGLALGEDVPLALRGKVKVASWAPANLPAAAPDFLNLVSAMYAKQPQLGDTLRQAISADAMADQAMGANAGMVPLRPNNAARILAEAGGKLLAQDNGPRIAVLELQGWDTHTNQGLGANGRMAQALQQMNDAFAALKSGLGAAWSKTVVMTATEFGRTARPNGSGGTDHGTATALFLGGGAVAGKRVIANWPGLEFAQLYQNRDLAPTTDFRAVAKGVLAAHLALPQDALSNVVFPQSGQVRPMQELLRA
ncbi:MAG TPA: DUF1501 domain-containing protein [Candidatus Cybelea sp.]|nr:DUF1501 domain-containing protein [Candidatus Cybelea sp.]